ncbi:Small secreted protein with six-cysteine repeat motif-containing protein [Pleurotus pulmonarius]
MFSLNLFATILLASLAGNVAAQSCLTTSAGCPEDYHCCPRPNDLATPAVCTSIWQYCPYGTCEPGIYGIKCPAGSHCCSDRRGARCQPSGELCNYIIDDI